jgi:prefoldin subunit 5
MALQCQDMTSQRIEHVGEAMTEMREHLDDGRPATPATDAEARHFIFRAGQIQLQQVQSVFDQLNNAADSLKSGIQSLRTDAGAAAGLAVKVGSTALDSKVASQCQAGIGEILNIVKQAVHKIAVIISAFEPLQASFVDCTGKATALAGDVRVAGLNAQVYSIRAPDGATLEVLAARVHAISAEVIEQVERMGAELNHTSEMVNNLRQRLEDFEMLGQTEEAVLAIESALSQKKLADLDSAIPVQIRCITQRQETFALSVEKVLAEIKFPVTVAQASSRSIGFFQDLVAWGEAGGAELLAESAAAHKIERLQSKYTMASERDAHSAALRPTSAPAEAADASPAIELFDDVELPAVGDSSGTGKLPDEPSLPPMVISVIEVPRPAPAMTEETSTGGTGLGDNVEFF